MEDLELLTTRGTQDIPETVVTPISQLSPRETSIFALIGRGRTSKQIASLLNLSVETISSYRKSICKKLGLHSTAELAAYAARHFLPALTDMAKNPLLRGIVNTAQAAYEYIPVDDGEKVGYPGLRSSACAVLFTGLSGAGKTTIAEAVAHILASSGWQLQILDGDIIRSCLWKELGYSPEDWCEHLLRMTFIAQLLLRNGTIPLITAVAPFRSARAKMRSQLQNCVEVYVNAPLQTCEHRDPKGLYQKARSGNLPAFIGIGSDYEPPIDPTVECRTDRETIEQSVQKVLGAVHATLLPNQWLGRLFSCRLPSSPRPAGANILE